MAGLIKKACSLLKSERADVKFDSSVQIVISFIIGAIILTILVSVFGSTIGEWITSTVGSWFSSGVGKIPSLSPAP